jgi:hypothetical protein
MGRGKNECPLGGGNGEAQGMIDRAGSNFVVASQAYKNGDCNSLVPLQ